MLKFSDFEWFHDRLAEIDMQFLNGITLLLIYQLVGEVTVRLLGIPIPGPVLGMVMLFITLMIRGAAPDSVEQASGALLSHLSLLFVPAGVGMMAHFHRIAEEWVPITLSLLLSTVITMVATALIMQATTRWLVKQPMAEEQNND
ncbi:LrgA protein [Marinobacter santoriniensis NKSG1]|uniref:LrgA protein n=2 Tax=Marinobacter santoriniensis TaxID=523742 RepID=M7D6M2_9GAMM|nr:LrgA protein [Marinobacter santoriniensis NKSG1]